MLIVTVLLVAPVVLAQTGGRETTEFTFDGPVMVPDATLPAGTYVFKLQDAESNRRIVEIWNEDETQLMTTALTIPMVRVEPADEVIVQFQTTPEGTPPAIKGWYYPGQSRGLAFVYPDEQAARIARTTKTLVLSSDLDPEKQRDRMREATVAYVDERGGRKPLSADEQAYMTHRPPNVAAAPADRAQGSGRVAQHGLEGEDLAEHHLSHIIRLSEEALEKNPSGEVRTALEQIRDRARKSFKALGGGTS
jgi:hypothetical protein